MTLEELKDRMQRIGEDCGDLEVDFYEVYNLYLDVLIAIANRQCEGASSREFAKEVIQIELSMYDILSSDPDALQAMQNRLAGKPPPPEPGAATSQPPAEPWHAPWVKRKKPPKVRAKKPPRAKQKKHK
jgi:hypothetical protein